METTRLWMARALVFAASGALLMIVGVPGCDFSSGPVWGRVSHNGRPLTGGAVVFYSTDGDHGTTRVARIDKDGCYAIKSKWSRPGSGKDHYKICIMPANQPQVMPHSAPPSEGRSPKAVLVSFNFQSEPTDDEMEVSEVPKRFRSALTTDLEVKLGPEPARIDIDLKD